MKIVTVKPGPVDTIEHLGTTAKRLLLLHASTTANLSPQNVHPILLAEILALP
jgi:hypothetical protein